MGAAGGIMQGAGALMHIAGTYLQGRADDIKRQKLLDIANTPGVDFSAITQGALAGYNQNYDAAQALDSKLTTDQQAILNAQEEQALPGIAAARGQDLSAISGLFGNYASWLQGVQRRGAALGVGRGLFGSGAGQLQTLHLSDQEQQARTALGTGLLSTLIGSMKLANTPGIAAFLGPSISQQLTTRSNERTQRMSYLEQAANVRGMTGQFADSLQWAGATLIGEGSMNNGLQTNPQQPQPKSSNVGEYFGGDNTIGGTSSSFGINA